MSEDRNVSFNRSRETAAWMSRKEAYKLSFRIFNGDVSFLKKRTAKDAVSEMMTQMKAFRQG